MYQIRHDPIKNIFVAIATKRQNRTFHPRKDYCPLCPEKNKNITTEIPKDKYDIVVFENRFPAFTRFPDKINKKTDSFYKSFSSYGICEVICYTQEHNKYLEDLPFIKVENLIRVWADRFYNLGNQKRIKYVLIFENKGKEIGVTLSHPHGQVYAFGYIPTILKEELRNSREYHKKTKKCLHCSIIETEIKEKKRILIKNNSFIAFIPFYAKWPYEVHIYPLKHLGNLCQLNSIEIASLAEILKELINRYNLLFGFRMSYSMVIHQNPTDGKEYDYYHFHFEFYPPLRTNNKLKYLAGCELGSGTYINDTLPEEKAEELRNLEIK